ncbi:MAG: SLC13 family permease [Candidatus Methylomirabilales bacterium]
MTRRQIRGIIGVAIPLLLWLTPIAGLPPQGQHGLALVAFAILYWVLEPIPPEWTSLLLLILVPFLGVGGLPIAFSGFTTGAFWLVFASLLLGEGVLHTGLGKRLALLSLKLLGTRYESALAGLLLAGLILGFLVPSGVGRVSLVLPIAIAIGRALGFDRTSAGMAGLTMGATFGAVFPPYAILTSNLPNLVLLGTAEMSAGIHIPYSEWLLLLGPPIGLFKLLLCFLLIRLLFRPDSWTVSEQTLQQEWRMLGPFSQGERRMLWIGGVVLLLWATDKLHGVRPSWIGVGGAVTLLLPGVAVLNLRTLRQSLNVPLLIYCAGILSIGAITRQAGLAEWMGNIVLALLPGSGTGLGLQIVLIALLSTGLSLLLTNPVLPAVLTPILTGYAERTGFPLLPVLIVQSIGVGTPLFPYQIPPIPLALGFKTFTHAQVIKAMLLLALLTAILVLPATVLYWSLLGLLP